MAAIGVAVDVVGGYDVLFWDLASGFVDVVVQGGKRDHGWEDR